MNRRVVKLGGSLLLRPTLIADLRRWLVCHPADQTLLVVGGGSMVEAVRQLDSIRPMRSESVHWLCVELLHASFVICCDWFPDWDAIAEPSELQRQLDASGRIPSIAWVSPQAFYTSRSDQLPEDWRTTTDSIAALLARLVDADELVLLKSCVVPESISAEELVADGVVDSAFIDESSGRCIFDFDRTVVEQLPTTDIAH